MKEMFIESKQGELKRINQEIGKEFVMKQIFQDKSIQSDRTVKIFIKTSGGLEACEYPVSWKISQILSQFSEAQGETKNAYFVAQFHGRMLSKDETLKSAQVNTTQMISLIKREESYCPLLGGSKASYGSRQRSETNSRGNSGRASPKRNPINIMYGETRNGDENIFNKRFTTVAFNSNAVTLNNSQAFSIPQVHKQNFNTITAYEPQDSEKTQMVSLKKPIKEALRRVSLLTESFVNISLDDQIPMTSKYVQNEEELQKGAFFVPKNPHRECKDEFKGLLMTTNFYSGLQEEQQTFFEKIFTDEQIDTILTIDKEAGYMPFDKRRICEALNNIKPRQRRLYFQDLQEKLKNQTEKIQDDLQDKTYFDEKDLEGDFIKILKQKECCPQMPAGYRLAPIIEWLEVDQKLEILLNLADDILSSIAFLTALCMEEGQDTIWDFFIKFWPKICHEARLYSLKAVIDCKNAENGVFQTGSQVPRKILEDVYKKDRKWNILLQIPPHISKQVQSKMNKVIFNQILPDSVVQLLSSFNNIIRDQNYMHLNEIMEQNQEKQTDFYIAYKKAIQIVWECLNPLSRRPIIQETFKNADERALEFYRNLDLDSRVEFMSEQSEQYQQAFWSMEHMDKSDKDLKLEMQVLQSEALHHQNFYLKEGYVKKTETEFNPSEKLEPMLEKLVKDATEDMKKTINVVPFDRAGDYLQCIPRPNSDNEFYVIQPYGLKNAKISQNRVFGKLQPQKSDSMIVETPTNYDHFHPNSSGLEIYTSVSYLSPPRNKSLIKHSDTHYNKQNDYSRSVRTNMRVQAIQSVEDTLSDTFGIVSIWKYAGMEMGIFQCEDSFTTPQIIAFNDPSKKLHNQTYLFNAQDDRIFFFCKEKNNRIDKGSDTQLMLCIIKETQLKTSELQESQEKNEATEKCRWKSKNYQDNCFSYAIAQGSDLETFLLSQIEDEKREESSLFQQTAPNLFNFGANQICVFSMQNTASNSQTKQRPDTSTNLNSSQIQESSLNRKNSGENSLTVPYLYFYNLDENQTIKKIAGGELFIDYIPKHYCKGDLYYLTDKMFMERLPFKDARHIKTQMTDSAYQIAHIKDIDFSLDKKDEAITEVGRHKKKKKIKFISTYKYDLYKSDDMEDYLSRNHVWIKWIKTMRKDSKYLKEFAVSTVNVLTREKKVVIIDIEKCIEKKTIESSAPVLYSHQIKIKEPKIELISDENAIGIFASKIRHFNKKSDFEKDISESILQVVTENYDSIEFNFYRREGNIKSHNKTSAAIYTPSSSQDNNIKTPNSRSAASSNIEHKEKPKFIDFKNQAQTYQSFKKKSFIHKQRGQRIFPMEVIIDEEGNEMTGAFVSKEDFSIHWIHEKFSSKKAGRNSQAFQTLPQFQIEFPILCFERPYPDGRELTMVNLADQKAARIGLQLNNLKFICFVSHRSPASDRSSICFLARDMDSQQQGAINENQAIVHCMIHCEKVFEKKVDKNMSHYDVDVENLGRKAQQKAFQKQLASIVRIESLHDLEAMRSGKSKVEQCFIMQTISSIYIYTHYDNDLGQWRRVSNEDLMQPLVMQRGFNNKFYYVECDQSASSDLIFELHVWLSETGKWVWTRKPVFELTSGRAIALELDPDNVKDQMKIASSLLKKKGKVFDDRTFTNELFVIDEQMQLWQLQEDLVANSYFSVERQSLAIHKDLAPALRYLKINPWTRASIAEKSITIQERTLNFNDEYSWVFSLKDRLEKWKWQVSTCFNVQDTHRQVMLATRQEHGITENAFVFKLHPSSRKVSLIGDKRLQAIKLLDFITNELLLIQMKGNYWCLIDTSGQIREIPASLLHILKVYEFNQMYTKYMYERGTILAIFQARTVTFTVEFSHRGEVMHIQKFVVQEEDKESDNIMQGSFGISADKFGIVYRFWHKTVPGECGKVQMIKVREAPSDEIIKPQTSEDRKRFLLERKETLNFEREKSYISTNNNHRRTNITPQDQQLFTKKFIRQDTLRKNNSLHRHPTEISNQTRGARDLDKSCGEQEETNLNQYESFVKDKEMISGGQTRTMTMYHANRSIPQRNLKKNDSKTGLTIVCGEENSSIQISKSDQSESDSELIQKSQKRPLYKPESMMSQEEDSDSDSIIHTDPEETEEKNIDQEEVEVNIAINNSLHQTQNSLKNQFKKLSIDKIEPELEPEHPRSNSPIIVPQIRKKLIPLCTETETERTGRLESNRMLNGFKPLQYGQFSHFNNSQMLIDGQQNVEESYQKDLKIVDIVFLHEQSEKIQKEVPCVIICGDYLCWQQGNDRTKIHISKLQQLKLESRGESGKSKKQPRTLSLEQLKKFQIPSQGLQRQDRLTIDKINSNKDINSNAHVGYKAAQELHSKIIDLSPYLIDMKVKDVQISVAPSSTHLSQRTQNKIDFSNCQSVNIQLLQVTINDRAIIFDLNSFNQTTKKFFALRDISDMKQLTDPERFVCCEFNVHNCYSQPLNSKMPSYRVCRQLRPNKSKDCFFEMQSWRKINRDSNKLSNKNEIDIKEPSKVFGFYKTYNETDFEELKRIQKHIKDRRTIKQLDLEVLCSTFLGCSIFSVAQSIQVLKLIYEKLQQFDYKMIRCEEDEEEGQLEHHFFRRLYQTLMIPIPKLQNKFQGTSQRLELFHFKHQLGMFSCLEMIAYSTDTSASEILMSIALLCKQTSVICFADTVQDIRELLRTKMIQTVKLMDHSFFETYATKKIISVTWPKDEQFLAFKQNSCLISTDDCIKGVEDAYVKKKSRIEYLYNTLKKKKQDEAKAKNENNRNKTIKNQSDEQVTGNASSKKETKNKSIQATTGNLKREDEGNELFGLQKDMTLNTVQVRLLDLGWLYADGNVFLDFIDVLQSADYSQDIFASEFIKTLLDVFWSDNEVKIFRKIFLPYMMYLIVTLIYMVHIVNEHTREQQGNWFYVGIINMFNVTYQLYIEYTQIKQTGFQVYITSPMNVLDSFQYFSVFFMIFLTLFDIDCISSSARRVWCSLLVVLMWAKLFDWLRMFNKTSFYISLILTTVRDILPFFAIFPIFLFAFGSAMFILDTNGDSANVLGEYGENYLFNIFMNQYLLSLGYFDSLEQYKISSQNEICFIFFVLASFFSTVTALNMIIAIMSDTFTKVTESYEQHSRQMKIGILSDYILHIKKNQNKGQEEDEAQFLAIVTSTHDRQGHSEWEGTLNAVRQTIRKHAVNLDHKMNERIQEVKDMMDILQARLTVQDKETKKQINEQNRNIKQISESIAEDVKEVKELLIKSLSEAHTQNK